jgi:hypothetical protein
MPANLTQIIKMMSRLVSLIPAVYPRGGWGGNGGKGTTPLVITFNSNATIADAQQLLRSITFRSIGHFQHQTDVNVTLTDGDGGVSNVATLSLNVVHGQSGNTGPGAPAHHGQ